MENAKRPPVIVVMGHVDHGKTTLLDVIRKTDVAAREYGGITQSIGAYQVALEGHEMLTFIDTPGHEAFSKMRSRGANVADIAVLVVAANDSVMPQTIESIKIIQEAKIPFIVAINKTDLPEANVDKVIQDLLRYNVILENYGGDIPFVKISAKKGEGVKELLDLIHLLWEMNEEVKTAGSQLNAVIIESKMDKNKGPVATAIIKSGKLSTGENIYIGDKESKIRALFDFNEKPVKEAKAGEPVLILGLSEVPAAGSVIASEQAAAVDSFIKSQQVKENALNLIIRADTAGSLEAIIPKLAPNINILDSGTGEITEKDIMFAKSTGAVVVGFNVRANASVTDLAKTDKIILRTYKIIYELLDELADAADGAIEKLVEEEVLGVAQIVAQFPYEKMMVAGVRVTDGRLARGDRVKINDIPSKIKDLRVGREQVSKVEKGKECGVLLDPQLDFKLGDTIIAHN